MKTALLFALAVSTALTGCAVEPYCINCGDASSHMDAVVHDVNPIEVVTPDASADGDGPVCNPLHLMDDPFNCGSCGTVCNIGHAIPACANGQCVVMACDVGWVDLNHLPGDGCEYQCLATGPEACDGQDNDCNGMTDEGFDLADDPMNCGACATACVYANGTPTCMSSHCTLGACATGFADNNHDPSDGCEYHCPVYPPLPYEVCNGLDDNCDGHADEATALQAAPSTLCVTRAGTPCAGTTSVCEARHGVTTWYCDYGTGVEFDDSLPNGIVAHETLCDGIDNDCSGEVDDTFPELGRACDNAALGACRDVGQVRCSMTDPHATRCDLTVAPDPVPGAPFASELCNNVDDDCDGVVDNLTGAHRIVRDMVHVTSGGQNVYVDRFEASRPDATSSTAGVVNARSCSNANVQPWTRATFADAAAACASSGMRLCTAAEWGAACAGASNSTYPYGNAYSGGSCNGADFATPHTLAATGASTLSACVTPTGLHDLSGNVKEWTTDAQGTNGGTPPQTIYVIRGGSFESPQLGLTCATNLSRASADEALDDLGFRCCSSTAP